MKKHYMLLVLAVFLIPVMIFSRGNQEKSEIEKQTLTVYAYDSFVSEWGPGPLVVQAFKEKTGIEINLVSAGNGGELLARLALETQNSQADVVVGISNELLQETIDSNLLVSYKSPVLKDVPDFLHFDSSYTLIPFNYGNYAFNYDSQTISDPPQSLDDLLDPRWRKSLILMDPRTSSVGMGLLEWTIAVYGDNFTDWWEYVKPNVLTIADGWSTGYGLFTQGEAPLVISYITSPVYHVLYEESERYQALLFEEGNMAVIEGVGIVRSTKNRALAQQFIDFLLTEAQLDIALTNIMYPVNALTPLPEAFAFAPKPDHSIMLDPDLIAMHRDTWINQWVEVMSK